MKTQLRLISLWCEKCWDYSTEILNVRLQIWTFCLWKLVIEKSCEFRKKNYSFEKISKKSRFAPNILKNSNVSYFKIFSEWIAKKSPYFAALYLLLSLRSIWQTYKEILRQRHENRLLCYYLYSTEESLFYFLDKNHLQDVLLKSNFLL